MPTISVYVTDAQYGKLLEIAKDKNKKISNVVQEIINDKIGVE